MGWKPLTSACKTRKTGKFSLAIATPARSEEISEDEKERQQELRKCQLLQLRADFHRAMQRLPAGCIPIATDGGYTAENTDPDCGPVTPIDIAGWGVTVRKSVAE